MEEMGQLAFFQGDTSKVIAYRQYPIRWDLAAESMGCYGKYV